MKLLIIRNCKIYETFRNQVEARSININNTVAGAEGEAMHKMERQLEKQPEV